MNKRLMAALLAGMMMVSVLAGCSGNESTSGKTPDTSVSSTDKENQETSSGSELKDRYTFTAQEAGSTILVIATAITENLKPYLPDNVELDILPTGATVASNTMVNEGQADIGFGEAGSKWAVDGIMLFDKPHEKIRAVAGGLQYAQMQAFMTREFSEKYGIETFEDLLEKKPPVNIYSKTKGSMGQAAAEIQLEAYGITYDDIKSWGGSITETGVSDISDAMKDKRADLWLDNLPAGHLTASELVQLADIKILRHTKAGLEKIRDYGFYDATVPAGTWKGTDEDIVQPGSTTMLIASSDVSDEFVYLLCKSLDEHTEDIKSAHAALANFDMSIAWQLVNGVELHPGAEKYYKEKGYMQ